MSRRRNWKIAAGLVLSVWLAVLAWHVKREYFRPTTLRLAEAGADLVPSAAFYSVKLGGTPIGYAASRIDTVAGGFVLDDDLRLHVAAFGSDMPAAARTEIRLGESLELQDFKFSLRSDFGDFRVSGAIEGDTLLNLRITAGDDEQTLSLPTDGDRIVLPQVMPIHFALGGEPEPGQVYSFEVFDPSIMERQRVELELLGRETLLVPDSADYDGKRGKWTPARYDTIDTWHVRQSFSGVELESWLDPDGMVVRATSPLGYSIERTAFEIAWNEYRALENSSASAGVGAPDIIERSAISVGTELPRGERLASLTVRLLNVDLAGFDLDGSSQELRGDTLVVRGGSRPEVTYRLPAEPSRWPTELRSTPLIQANDPEIARAAAEIVGDTRDPALAAARLNDWVYGSLEKEITLSVPSARQVLAARRGDCNEHTVLYVALARAVGLPTRPVAGLVYVHGRFYYHAWPEVWLDDWVPVDPTLNQFPADASHLRFVVGGLARQVELVRLIGRLEMDVLEVEER